MFVSREELASSVGSPYRLMGFSGLIHRREVRCILLVPARHSLGVGVINPPLKKRKGKDGKRI